MRALDQEKTHISLKLEIARYCVLFNGGGLERWRHCSSCARIYQKALREVHDGFHRMAGLHQNGARYVPLLTTLVSVSTTGAFYR